MLATGTNEDTSRDVVCQYLTNYYECSRAVERRLLAGRASGVSRRGPELTIALTSGRSVVFVDSQPESPAFVGHTYAGSIPSVKYFVLELHYSEGGAYLLVNGHTGASTFSHGFPVPAPDGRRLAAGNVDLEARYSPTTLQIWRLADDNLVLEWEHDFVENGRVVDTTWGPSGLRWIGPDELAMVKEYQFGERRGSAVVRLAVTGWSWAP